MLRSSLSGWNTPRAPPTAPSARNDQQEQCQPQQLPPPPQPQQQQQQRQQPPQHLVRPTPTRTGSDPTAASRRGRPEGRPPRPMNAWLLFRTAQLKVLQRENPDGLRKSQGELSKLIAEMWKNCDHEIRQGYEDLARRRKEEFRLAYPDYRYGPSKEKPKLAKAPAPERSAARTRPRLHVDPPPPSASGSRLDEPTSAHAAQLSFPAEQQYSVSPISPATASALPTPVSAGAHSSSARTTFRYQTELSTYSADSAYHSGYMQPTPPMPSSAPASTSTFQSSPAYLGASIGSLAPPVEPQSRQPHDHFRRRASFVEGDYDHHATLSRHDYAPVGNGFAYELSSGGPLPPNHHRHHHHHHHRHPPPPPQQAESHYPSDRRYSASSHLPAPQPVYYSNTSEITRRAENGDAAILTPVSPRRSNYPYAAQSHLAEQAHDQHNGANLYLTRPAY
ncbi:Bromodomain-containing protein 4 [Rhodotorula mucilaginosa]|uniref:Bromodomain-containing protein 4 n=1 Tax=Rhodotorula mucilaginosa TaxID=5537 RepID=A0A9P6W318_RHOMI|nr:Bromodomain-containing protein 4 [Rhodotorula mucilaginosa]